MGALPQHTVEYNGFITEGKRWADFRHRPDDIFICTPGKNGTTWTQAICAMLVFGRADIDVQPGNISPWYDANFTPPGAVNALLEAQTHRRFIKTHTPLDGFPFYPECTYLAVYRDPRDVFFSFANHLGNMSQSPREVPPATAEGFLNWCNAPREPGRTEQHALAWSVYHQASFWPWRHLPNIHFFHYADLKRDPVAGISGMAKAIGVKLDDATIRSIADATSFKNMREHATQFAPGAGTGVWKNETEFFNKGRQGQWRDVLGERELAVYREAMAKALPPDAVAWVENGGPLPSR